LPEAKKPKSESRVHSVGALPERTNAAPALKPFAESIPKKTDTDNGSIDTNVFMLGWELEGGKARVALSDGRWVDQEDGLTQVTPSYCIVLGHIYRMESIQERLRDEEHPTARRSSRTRQQNITPFPNP
jgi:hypothetical protein